MKSKLKINLTLFLSIALFAFSYSQISIGNIKFGKNGTFSNKWYKGELTLKNGEVLSGWLKYESGTKSVSGLKSKTNSVLYKVKKNGKKKKYKKDEFSSFIVTKNDGKTEKYAIVYTSKKRIQLLKVIVEGRVCLYEAIITSRGPGANNKYKYNKTNTHEYTNMYIKRENENIASNKFFSSVFNNFKKTAKNYFSDCPELVRKIENNEFNKNRRTSGLKKIVEYYNNQCN